MQRLNIQLSRHIQTTRRPRWVVWLLPILFVLMAIASYYTTTLWFTRDTIYEAAPENTIVAFRFFVGGSKKDQISTILGNIPLISDRAIDFADLSPYTNGEFVVFLKKDGSHSVALRTNAQLPQSLLDSEQIVQKQIDTHIVLLSAEAEQTQKLAIAPKLIPVFTFPGKTWVGEIIVSGQKKRGWIFNTKKSLVLSLPIQGLRTDFFGVPDNAMAFISSKTTSTSSDTDLITPFLPLIAPIIGSEAKSYLDQISQNINTVFLTNDDRGVGFLLSSKPSDDKQVDIRKLLQSISALNTPKIQKTALSDGTFIQELISDPDSVSVEQVTILGLPMNRVGTSNQSILAGFTDDKHLILTNRENLLRFYKEKSKSKTKQTICGANSLGISFDQLSNLIKLHATSLQAKPFLQLSEQFTSVGVVSELFSTDINICKR